VVFCALWPAGKIQTALYELEDHWAAVHHIQRQTKPPPRLQEQTVDWPQFCQSEQSQAGGPGTSNSLRSSIGKYTPGSRDAGFLSGVKGSPTWIDLDLLLRCLTTVHARPLILSMPLAGDFYDHAGVSRSARDEFYRKLPALVEQYHFSGSRISGARRRPGFSYPSPKVISQQKAGHITTVPLTISFTGVCHNANK
jgi:Protein involved in D-alanine esterification of lipoteichoic acid and wall teichoic acid (D-alanine transfer protein)